MSKTEATKELILKYWRSWQQPSDFDEMRACLADDAKIDGGMFSLDSADAFRTMVEANNSPWRDVKMLDSVFTENTGAIFYEGIEVKTNIRMRVAEHCVVKDGKISKAIAVITQLGEIPE